MIADAIVIVFLLQLYKIRISNSLFHENCLNAPTQSLGIICEQLKRWDNSLRVSWQFLH